MTRASPPPLLLLPTADHDEGPRDEGGGTDLLENRSTVSIRIGINSLLLLTLNLSLKSLIIIYRQYTVADILVSAKRYTRFLHHSKGYTAV